MSVLRNPLHEEIPLGSSSQNQDSSHSPQLRGQARMEPKESHAFTYVSLAVHAFLGVFLRLVIIYIFTTFQPSLTNHSVMFPNFLGSFVMGIVVFHKKQLTEIHPQLCAGILTGFCGSLTSFSTVMVAVAKIFFGVYNCQWTVAERIFLFFETYFFNFFVAFTILSYAFTLSSKGSCQNVTCLKDNRKVVNLLLLLFYIIISCISIILSILVPVTRKFALSILLGQFGVVVRYLLGKYVNPRVPSFPVGTFLANVLGTIISSSVNGVMVYQSDSLTPLTKDFLFAISNGIAGALTTVSSFVSEIHSLPTYKNSSIYSMVTLCISQIIGVLPFIILFYNFDNSDNPIFCDK